MITISLIPMEFPHIVRPLPTMSDSFRDSRRYRRRYGFPSERRDAGNQTGHPKAGCPAERSKDRSWVAQQERHSTRHLDDSHIRPWLRTVLSSTGTRATGAASALPQLIGDFDLAVAPQRAEPMWPRLLRRTAPPPEATARWEKRLHPQVLVEC